MRYIVYSDGASSLEKNMIGCGFLILTESNYIASDNVKIKGQSNPTQAETIGVGLAAAYMIDNLSLTESDVVEFFVDCAPTIDFVKKYVDNNDKVFSNNKQVVASVNIVRKLAKVCKVELTKVRGHKVQMNPNKFVDRLAKLSIRGE